MNDIWNLQRFLDAQQEDYPIALAELKRGRKSSHWMWYIFPQVAGLGQSQTSRLYAIRNLEEAGAYLQHPILGKRLIEISSVLLRIPGKSAHEIFGTPDDLKFCSCMTLFSMVKDANPVFQQALDKYFDGLGDEGTINIIKSH